MGDFTENVAVVLLVWDAQSRSIYFNVQTEGYTALYRAALEGSLERLTSEGVSLFTTSVNTGGQAAGMQYVDDAPGQIVTFEVGDPQPKLVYLVLRKAKRFDDFGDADVFRDRGQRPPIGDLIATA